MSFTILFEVLTLEERVDVTRPIEASPSPVFWIYFASFILIGTFIIINLFISVIVRKSEETHKRVEDESAMQLAQKEIMREMRDPQDPGRPREEASPKAQSWTRPMKKVTEKDNNHFSP